MLLPHTPVPRTDTYCVEVVEGSIERRREEDPEGLLFLEAQKNVNMTMELLTAHDHFYPPPFYIHLPRILFTGRKFFDFLNVRRHSARTTLSAPLSGVVVSSWGVLVCGEHCGRGGSW